MRAGADYPSLAVACPTCGAPAGSACFTSGGVEVKGFHVQRGDLARARAAADEPAAALSTHKETEPSALSSS